MKFKRLSLKINNIRLLFYILLFTFIYISPVQATNYNWYFANSTQSPAGNDANACTELEPCETLTKVQSMLDTVGSGDTATVHFKRGGTWEFDGTNTYVIKIDAQSGIVKLTAYGSGPLPILDGGITDWSSLGSLHHYDATIHIQRAGCTIEYLEIKRVFAVPIRLWAANNTTIQYCKIHDFGNCAIGQEGNTSLSGLLIQNNEIYEGANLFRDGALDYLAGHPPALSLFWAKNASSNTYRYNVIHDFMGEGISLNAGVAEYNVIYNVTSGAILAAPGEGNEDGGDITVRYNLILGTVPTTYYHSSFDGNSRHWNAEGITVQDENNLGNNDNMDVKIYGNTIIGVHHGIRIFDNSSGADNIPLVKIYNNTLIDNYRNITIGHITLYDDVRIYNNSFIHYDLVGGSERHTYDSSRSLPNANFFIDNNAFWTSDDPTPDYVTNFTSNYVIQDPKLYGEQKESPVNWDGLTGLGDINFVDCVPSSGSGIFGTGKKLEAIYSNKFLTYGTDFSALPDTVIFQLFEKTDSYSWDIGAISPNNGLDINPPRDLKIFIQ